MAKNDIFAVLKDEHAEVKEMLTELIEECDTLQPNQLERRMSKIDVALRLHMQVEEKAVYPELKRLEELKDSIGDAVSEHQELKDELDKCSGSSIQESQLRKIMKLIEHHVKEEEQEVFPTATRAMSNGDYEAMSKEALQLHRQLKEKARA